jgi:hypothetical protein
LWVAQKRVDAVVLAQQRQQTARDVPTSNKEQISHGTIMR